MAECDEVVAVRQFQRVKHCATLLNGNEHDDGDVEVDEQIVHAAILIHLSIK